MLTSLCKPISGSMMRIVAVKKEQRLSNKAYMRSQDMIPYCYYDAVIEKCSLFKLHSKSHFALINDKLVVRISVDNSLGEGEIALHELHCEFVRATVGGSVICNLFPLSADSLLVELYIYLEFLNCSETTQINALELEKKLRQRFRRQVMSIGQKVGFEYKGSYGTFTVIRLFTARRSPYTRQGLISATTKILFDPYSCKHSINITDQEFVPRRMFWREIKLDKVEQELMSLGIGGMASIFSTIFERVVSTRIHQGSNLTHVKGILLYGPPGTGKTLLAKKLAELLHAKEPKVVNGPELLDRWTGASEYNARALFEEAIQDYETYGDQSPLHFVIFDEIDSVAQKRGRNPADTGSDRVVNQLLTMIDGVNKMNNILIVGTTNRKSLIDDALLRSGRLELHIEVGLPDETSREKILKVHTDKVARDQVIILQPDVNFKDIASKTTGRSGADLAAIVGAAVAYALNRARRNEEEQIKVDHNDFIRGIGCVCPASENHVLQTLEECRSNASMKLDSFFRITDKVTEAFKQIQQSQKHNLVTCLLSGPSGGGKTTIAAFIPERINSFQHIDMVSLSSMIKLSENQKAANLVEVFENARKFQSSFIILDDIERLVEYNPLERRCSNIIFNTLLVQLKELPKNTKMLVVGITSNKKVLDKMGFFHVFSLHVEVPLFAPSDTRKIMSYFDVARPDELEEVETGLHNMSIKNLCVLIDVISNGELEDVLAGRRRIDIEEFLTTMSFFKNKSRSVDP